MYLNFLDWGQANPLHLAPGR